MIREHKLSPSAKTKRHVVVGEVPGPRCDLWQGGQGRYHPNGCLVLWRGGEDYTKYTPPSHVMAAFEAGEDILPIIDWLIEQYGDAHPWLHDLAAAAVAAEGAV